jgi:glycosyltransferase involved in cell wall biosynthesis
MTAPRILAFAYACEPGEGSEPGAGWAWGRLLAGFGDTWVITRANNREPIEKALALVPESSRLHFAYVDLPAWARAWKRRGRGIHFYSVLWQLAALRTARRLHRRVGFDVVWHLTLANAWLGSTAPLVGPPFVYGPVGGGVSVPWRLAPLLGVRGAMSELVRSSARGLGRYLNPLARMAWRRAELILVQNEETRHWLPARYRSKAEVFPNVILEGAGWGPSRPREGPPGTALFAGRLLPWKGGALALKTMRQLPQWTLLIAGSGPDEPRLRRLARRWGIEDSVRFLGRIPRERLLQVMSEEADVLLFPSLREEAGWVAAEASSYGVRVVCLNRGGPPLLGGSPIDASTPRGTARVLAAATVDSGTSRQPPPSFDPLSTSARLRSALELRVGTPTGILDPTLRRPTGETIRG